MVDPSPLPAAPAPPPRLLDVVRQVVQTRLGHTGLAERYAAWTRRLVLFHK